MLQDHSTHTQYLVQWLTPRQSIAMMKTALPNRTFSRVTAAGDASMPCATGLSSQPATSCTQGHASTCKPAEAYRHGTCKHMHDKPQATDTDHLPQFCAKQTDT